MKIRSKVTIGLLSSVMCVAALAHAGYSKAGGENKVTFKTKTVGVTINGSLPGVEHVGPGKDGTLLLKANMQGIKTGIGDRDAEARKTFKTDKHKYVELYLDPAKFKIGEDLSGTGKLVLAGKGEPVKIEYDAEKTDAGLEVHAEFDVDITKHGIKPPCMLKVCVDDVTKVTVDVTLK